MWPHNEYILVETQRSHRAELLRAAADAALAHKAATHAPSLLDQGLAAVGRLLVRCGRRLEMRVSVGLNGV